MLRLHLIQVRSGNPVPTGFLLFGPLSFGRVFGSTQDGEHQQRLPAGFGTSLGCATRFVEPTRPYQKTYSVFQPNARQFALEMGVESLLLPLQHFNPKLRGLQ